MPDTTFTNMIAEWQSYVDEYKQKGNAKEATYWEGQIAEALTAEQAHEAKLQAIRSRPTAPVPEPAVLSARQVEYNELFWAAQLAGKSGPEAERLATNEIARRHGEAVNPANLSLAELDAHLRGMDRSVLFPDEGDEGNVTWDAVKPAPPIGVDHNAAIATAAANAATAQRGADANRLRSSMVVNHVDPAVIESTVAKFLAEQGPAAPKPGSDAAFATLVDTPELRAALGLRQKD